jgi:hypothetical protein
LALLCSASYETRVLSYFSFSVCEKNNEKSENIRNSIRKWSRFAESREWVGKKESSGRREYRRRRRRKNYPSATNFIADKIVERSGYFGL